MKVVINKCFGGFGLSEKAMRMLVERGHKEAIKAVEIFEEERKKWKYWQLTLYSDTCRHDPLLIAVIQELGDAANGPHAELKIIEIEGPFYRIDEYDGSETVHTPDDEWTWIDGRIVT